MIPHQKRRQITSGGVTDTAAFGISLKDTGHIATILRDTLYSDKVLAVLREYSANAWDAHRMSGKGDVPIKVTLPTYLDPNLIIQDFGPGLSHEDVFTVYTQYGASTKREDNAAVGMLGIGSKSAFAYSDSFTVVSCHGGFRRTYVAYIDESEIGAINLMAEEPCGEETGVSIQIAVRPKDISEFEQKAKVLYRHFQPRPDINTKLPEESSEATRLKNGTLDRENSGWVAVMGCVPYRADLSQLTEDGKSLIPDFIRAIGGTISFDIGEVQVNASREELKYSDQTKKALVKRLNDLVDEFITKMLDEIENGGFTDWEKMLKGQTLAQMRLPVPKEYDFLLKGYVNLPEPNEEEDSFTIHTKDRKIAKTIAVRQKARLVLKDDSRVLRGFELTHEDYLVYPKNRAKWDEVRNDLDALIKELRFTGIPIVNLSSLEWSQPLTGKRTNVKHKVKFFKLIKTNHYGSLSDNWEVVEREPDKNDVFVVISGFTTRSCAGQAFNIFDERQEDQKLAKILRRKLPDIYGYKETSKKPVDEEEIVGTHYWEWKKKFLSDLVTPTIIEQMRYREWTSSVPERLHPRMSEILKKELGNRHPITAFYNKYLRTARKVDRKYEPIINALSRHGILKDRPVSEPTDIRAALIKQYPLFTFGSGNHYGRWDMLFGKERERKPWFDYIRLVDADINNDS